MRVGRCDNGKVPGEAFEWFYDRIYALVEPEVWRWTLPRIKVPVDAEIEESPKRLIMRAIRDARRRWADPERKP